MMMNNKKSLLYIGNNLVKDKKYTSSLITLSNYLECDGYKVTISSNKKNKLLRLLYMCISVFANRKKADFLLIDTFSTTNFYYALVTSQIARFLKIRYIPILHGGNLPNRLSKNPILSRLIFMNSYKNIAPSGYLKHEFEKKGIETSIIPNILELKKYSFKERKNIKPRLLYVRAFDKTYNPLMAIEVLKELKEIYDDAKLCMIGPDKDGSLQKFKIKAQQYNLQNDVEITGVLSKQKWHEKSKHFDIFINTTNIDNTPVSVLEAMALGLPVVSTNVGGLKYIIQDKSNGILINKNDVFAMVDSIKDLIEGKYNRITFKAREDLSMYEPHNVIKKWNSILL